MSGQTLDTDTIVAVATAPGRGGVGVVRLSGPQSLAICARVTRSTVTPQPRHATWSRFHDAAGELLDSGLVLSFPGPASFTGEDVVELQGHGSPVVLDGLVAAAIDAGARLARPGEFSERAYLNGKLDLAQAEAVADLINAASDASARAAARSLQGEFSRLLNRLSEQLLALRVQVEAAIDFPDEDIELLAAPGVAGALDALINQIADIQKRTQTGIRLTEGARLVLVGAPNVGKSSVLNRLCGEDRAIVTEVAGTTRDLLREQLLLGGMPVELVDTAGLRETADSIEAEGVRRAAAAAREADLVLAVYDLSDPTSFDYIASWLKTEHSVGSEVIGAAPGSTAVPRVLIGNKTDLLKHSDERGPFPQWLSSKLALTMDAHPYSFHVQVSAATGAGLEELTERLVGLLQGHPVPADRPPAAAPGEEKVADRPPIQVDSFSARSRHLQALQATYAGLTDARRGIADGLGAELVAEYLRHAQSDLGRVCGEVTTDALLGEIFSSFCIGK